VVLGGSHARGRAQPGSDIDLYILYSEAAPFLTLSIRELAEAVNDAHGPVVTDFYGWGPWVNGGAWLTIGGQRVDFLYRSLEHMERVIAEAETRIKIVRQDLHLALPARGWGKVNEVIVIHAVGDFGFEILDDRHHRKPTRPLIEIRNRLDACRFRGIEGRAVPEADAREPRAVAALRRCA